MKVAHREKEFTSSKIGKNSATEEISKFCKFLEILFIVRKKVKSNKFQPNSSVENKNSEKQQILIKKLELPQNQEKQHFPQQNGKSSKFGEKIRRCSKIQEKTRYFQNSVEKQKTLLRVNRKRVFQVCLYCPK